MDAIEVLRTYAASPWGTDAVNELDEREFRQLIADAVLQLADAKEPIKATP